MFALSLVSSFGEIGAATVTVGGAWVYVDAEEEVVFCGACAQEHAVHGAVIVDMHENEELGLTCDGCGEVIPTVQEVEEEEEG